MMDLSSLGITLDELVDGNQRQIQDVEKLIGLASCTFKDDKAARDWFTSPRVEWYGMTPAKAIKVGRIKGVIEALERDIEGEISGV